jgi:hypothetical protein
MIGKTLVAANVALLAAMLFGGGVEFLPMALAIAGLAAASLLVLYGVVRTYRVFRERELLLGIAGFGMIAAGYIATLAAMLAAVAWAGAEAAVNVLIALGYGMVTVAWGWKR